MNFIKSLLASFIGTFVALGLITLLFFMGIAAITTTINFETTEGSGKRERILNLISIQI